MQSKYQKILNQLKLSVDTKKIKKGEKLPSIRELSKTYKCSKDTVQRALLELKYQKYIYPIEKSGYYVLENTDKTSKDNLNISLANDQYKTYQDFCLCMRETLMGRENYLFNYYPNQEGLEDLLQSIQNLLLTTSIYTRVENIVITAGTQQALYILSQIQFPNKQKEILIEQPTYHRMNKLLLSKKIPFQTIERNMEGIDLRELERIFQTGKIKFFYTIPRFHNPLGHSYSRKHKENILNLAQKYNIYIVEDDYLADFDKKKEASFHYLDTKECVVYIKSFSATLFPALRVSAIILPTTLKKKFVHYKQLLDYDTNLIMQKALSLYIDNHLFSRNKAALNMIKEKQNHEMTTLLSNVSLNFPYHIVSDGILLEIPNDKATKFKHSHLNLDFFESSYIYSCPYNYTKIKYSKDLSQIFEMLSKLNQ